MQVTHWGHDHLPRRVPGGPRLHKSNAPHLSFCSLHANFPPTHKIDNMQAVTLVEILCLRWEHSRTDVARRLDPAPLPADCHRAGASLICYGKVIVSACTGQL